jgi:hypothetical protein
MDGGLPFPRARGLAAASERWLPRWHPKFLMPPYRDLVLAFWPVARTLAGLTMRPAGASGEAA